MIEPGLILTREPDGAIMVGDDIKITVLKVTGRHVKIHIAAPRSVEVHRLEVYDRIQLEKLAEGGQ